MNAAAMIVFLVCALPVALLGWWLGWQLAQVIFGPIGGG